MKKALIKRLFVFVFLALSLMGCGGGSNSEPAPPGPSVYVGGYLNNGSTEVPGYWVNGSWHNLSGIPSVEEARTLSIAVSDSKVYLCGYYQDASSPNYGWYWANGTLTVLGENTVARQIFVSGSDVYVTGSYGLASKACYWVNGVLHELETTNTSRACTIYVSGEVVYAAGSCNSGSGTVACYWIDGERHDTTAVATASEANDIFISGTDIYMAGYTYTADGSKACYWINNTRTDLNPESYFSEAYSIFVSGSNVYIAGEYYNDYDSPTPVNVACYWQNGVKIDLEPQGAISVAGSVFVSGSNVYVSGLLTDGNFQKACYWLNGNKNIIGPTNVNSCGVSIIAL